MGFLELVGGLTERLVNTSIRKERMSLRYEAMRRAAANFFDLPPSHQRRAEAAFRGMVTLRPRPDGEVPFDRERLLALKRFFEEERENPVLAEELDKVPRESLPGTLRGLVAYARDEPGTSEDDGRGFHEVLDVLCELGEAAKGSLSRPLEVWAQLACVALADVGLLTEHDEEAVLDGRMVSVEAVEAYGLAKYELESSPATLR